MPEFSECGHGSNDRYSCFGCEYGESIGPELEPVMRPLIQVRYSTRYVQQVRNLGTDKRWPLHVVKP